jgi:hypothetical protein
MGGTGFCRHWSNPLFEATGSGPARVDNYNWQNTVGHSSYK